MNGEIQVDNGSLINSIKDYIVIAEKFKDEFISTNDFIWIGTKIYILNIRLL